MPLTFGEVYEDFKIQCPDLRDLVEDYSPFLYGVILVTLSDCRVLTYSYLSKKVEWV